MPEEFNGLEVVSCQKYIGIRRMIGERLRNSVINAPHIYQTLEIMMDKCFAFRSDLNKQLEADGMKVTFNDITVKAISQAVADHPDINSALVENVIYKFKPINVGVATDTDRGLMVPVIKDCGNKGLVQIAKETRDLVTNTRAGTAPVDDFKGATITVSNLGAYNIEQFTSVINSPEGCIVSIASIKERAVVENSQVVISKTMYITLGFDHRVVDGALGIRFANSVREYLENPDRIILQ